MNVEQIDERQLRRERAGGDFLLFIHEGGPPSSWPVDSYLFRDADLPGVLTWLSSRIPHAACWCLGLVTGADAAEPDSHLEVAWIVGADLLNRDPANLTAQEQRVVGEMLRRRHDVRLP